jgi:hypothetical protein
MRADEDEPDASQTAPKAPRVARAGAGRVRGRVRAFSDAQLRRHLEVDKLKVWEIAEKYEVSRQAVYERIDRLEQNTLAAASAPEESRRYVSQQLDAHALLLECLNRVRKLQAAADEWLRDADNPTHYDVGARACEIEVTYWKTDDEDKPIGRRPEKASLQELLDRIGGVGLIEATESRYADPRTLMLQTSQECRSLIHQGLELTQRLLDAKAQQEWRQVVVEAIGEVDPELRRAIEDRIRRRLRVYTALCGPAGAEPGDGQ